VTSISRLPSPSRRFQWRFATLLLVSVIFVFLASSIREGHLWDDDAAQYILHARNIVEGRPYADTGYLFNPEYATLGPASYPPGFPLLLAPIWALRGFDLHSMKLLEVVCFVVWLCAMGLYFERELGGPATLLLIAIIGFCPLFWEFKDLVGSDIPFAAVLFVALVSIQHLYYRQGKPELATGILAALLIAAAASIRSVGIMLIPAVAIHDFLRNRTITRFAVVSCVLSAAACTAVSLSIGSAGGTFSLFHMTAGTVTGNAATYTVMAAADLWQAGRFRVAAWLLEGATAAAVAWSIWRRWKGRRPLGIVEVFSLLYLAVMLVYKPHEVRFLFPVFPLYVAFVVSAAQDAIRALPGWRSWVAVGATCALAAFAYLAQYRSMPWGEIPDGFTGPRFMSVVCFLQQHTDPSDIILFRKPRVLPLLAGRRATTYAHVRGLGGFVHKVQPRYVVASYSSAGNFASDAQYLWPFLQAQGANAQLVYQNDAYAVYRVLAW